MIKSSYKAALFLLFSCWFVSLNATDSKNLNPPLFISLGSHCEPSQQLILNNLRSAAFPFDWLLTLNFEGFLALLEDDFKFFMNRGYLVQDSNRVLLNTYYQIDFRHELHDWPDNDFATHYPEIKEKYRRRISRFKECDYNKNRAYFIRAAFDSDLNPHQNLPTINEDCTKIDRAEAEALKRVLQQKFPKLDFYLVIINYAEENRASIQGIERVLEYKIRKSHKKEDYTRLFQLLVQHSHNTNSQK
jgi:hypothetical protein